MTRPGPALLLLAVCAVPGGLGGACISSSDISPAAQRIAAARSFGDDNRMTVTVEPGRVRETYAVDGPAWVASVHLSAPFGALRVENGNFAEQHVLAEVANVDVGAAIQPRLTALAVGARRDSRCEDPTLADRPELLLPSLPNEVTQGADGAPALLLELRVPPCSALAIDLLLPAERTAWTTAVLRVDVEHREALQGALASIGAIGADHVQVMGHARRSGAADPYGRLRLELAELGLPYSVAFATDDLEASDAFHEAFGVSDWDIALGQQRLLSLNTATRYVGTERFGWLQGRTPAPHGGLAFMQVPPYDPDPPGADAIATTTDAGRLLGTLGLLGFRTLISAAGDGPSTRTFAGVLLHDVGRAQRLGDEARITWVTVERPWAAPPTCGAARECAAGTTCDTEGFCAPPCTADGECPGSVCRPEGRCAVSASVRISASPP